MRREEDWKDYFDEWILERGVSLCLGGSVERLIRTEEGYKAQVQGSRMYKVEVKLDEYGDFVDATCTCPYANGDEQFCKHEAAVLYTIFGDEEEGIEPLPEEDAPIPGKDEILSLLEEQLAHIDAAQARSLLLDAARMSETVRSSLIAHFSSASRDLLKISVNEALRRALYNDSLSELYNIASVQLAPLASRDPLYAYTLAMTVLTEGRELSGSLVDSSSGLRRDYADTMADILDTVWHNADKAQKQAIISNLHGMLDFYRFDAVSFLFMVKIVKDASLTEELLSCVRQARGLFTVDDQLWALVRLGHDRDQLIEFLKSRNDHASTMRLIGLLDEAGRWQECLDAIERFYGGDLSHMFSVYRDKYVDICKAQGYTERLRRLLLQELESPRWNALEMAKEYLELVGEDQKVEECRRLMGMPTLRDHRLEIASMSPDPELKMEYLEEVDKIEETYRLASTLAVGKCRGRLLALMESQLDRLENRMHTRAEYRTYATMLLKLSQLKNSKDWRYERVEALHMKYPSRKALIEETAWLLRENNPFISID